MSNYKNQEFDFIKRTKKIIEQYQNFQIEKEESFEVTLLLNCLVGLIIIPKQHWFDSLPTEIVSQKEWGINQDNILFIKEPELKTVKNIARHIRNSISHYNFIAFDNSANEINSIMFRDFMDDKKEEKTFEADISIEGLRLFTTNLTNIFLNNMK